MPGNAGRSGKGGIKGDAGRAERLAAQLRANLARRKERARKLATSGKPEETELSSPEGPADATSPASPRSSRGEA
jgi:hypothetical protein